MASEGSREIEAARLRLAAAKSQVSTASKNLDLVTKMMEMRKICLMQPTRNMQRHRVC